MISSCSQCWTLALLFIASLVAVVLCAKGNPNGINCYSCDSHVDPDCIKQEHMDKQLIMNCSMFITDQLPTHLRCVRIVSNTDVRGEVVIRRCALVGDCKYIAKNEKQSCHECAHDLCNGGK